MMKFINSALLFASMLFAGCSSPEMKTGPAPVFTTKANTRVHIDSMYTYHFDAMDSLNRPLEFRLESWPSWISFSESGKVLSGKPEKPGQFFVRLQVSNESASVNQDFMLTVYNDKTVNILPLGNSITNGTDSADGKTHFASYRRDLWVKLHAEELNFDFIGSWDKHHMGAEAPYSDFDLDHEGHSGWTAKNMFSPPDWDSSRGNIYEWLKTYSPDIVLVELGTNDVFQCRTEDDVVHDLTELFETIRAKNASVKFFVSNVIPLGPQWSSQNLCKTKPYGELVDAVNIKIAELVKTASTETSPVVIVDQFTGLDPTKYMYDDIHPNVAGEEIVATKWFEAIQSSLPKL